MRFGDQWYKNYEASTVVSGSSDYFDPSEFTQWSKRILRGKSPKKEDQRKTGAHLPILDVMIPTKLMQYNTTGVNTGYEWYCPAVRNYAWLKVINSAGFEIDLAS